ncbi:hypothetical protein GF402_02630 [Candidatus Fermentibacteria bacterium]|nr:hypothetical protein [Candidatus Fermentibacteria bacterium]
MIAEDAFAMIIGAMKSGTTTLYAYLYRHHQICPCRVKEPDFFLDQRAVDSTGSRYEDLWEFDDSVHRIALEASTGYTKYPLMSGVPERIADYGLRPKFIYILRDPFERIESHYNSTRRAAHRRPILHEHLINTSNYYMQLERYRRLFRKDRFLLLDFKQLKENPEHVMEKACRFLEVDYFQLPERALHENPTPYHSGAQRFYGRLIQRTGLRNPLPGRIKRIARKILGLVLPSRKRFLTPEEREIIRKRLGPDMKRLRKEYGVDVRQWGFS